MNHQKYLDRIKYKDDVCVSLYVLQNLQKAHLLNIPFENLDIHYCKPIRLDIDKIYNKIVEASRGGFCYELNGLFYELLKSIGYNVKMISARVYDKEKGYGEEFDHMAIIGSIDSMDYLIDVGFGEFAFYPLAIELEKVQEDPRGIFKVQKFDESYLQVSRKENELWIPEYIFSLTPRNLNDFEQMCNYHQTSTESHFTHKKICSIATEKGRITLTNNTLKIFDGKHSTECVINKEEFSELLWNYFQIKIN